ncbi:MAG TPA: RNA methyltransferase [Acidimicrobiales bacterium]|nr:RNA methyltransferase [Acidimicrobiales bacterium]
MSDRSTGAVPVPTTAPRRELGFKSDRVQRLRRLLRQPKWRAEESAFVIEGPKLLTAALDAGSTVESVYVAPGTAHEAVGRAEGVGVPIFTLAAGVIERVADTVTPQGVLAVCTRTASPMENLRGTTMVIVAVGIQDPGNLGTIFRSAGAATEAGVICCTGTVDPYNPKCLRASAGALFHQKLVARKDPVEVLEELGSWGVQRLATEPSGGAAPDAYDLVQPTALVFGNEGRGLDPALLRLVDGTVTIPMSGPAESLNVAMAATVVCFEAARQRRQ